MSINYNNRKFKVVSNSENGELSENLIFHYKQNGNVLTCVYSDDQILAGHILGIVHKEGTINLSYHQVNSHGELNTGTCISTPEILLNGKIRILENWKWTSGDFSSGSTTLEEL